MRQHRRFTTTTLKALRRLLPRIKKDYPQLRFVLALDNLYACGPVFALLRELGWSFVVTFKEGRTMALWREYQALRSACPDNRFAAHCILPRSPSAFCRHWGMDLIGLTVAQSAKR
jgi:hypothetical protein